jgi:hypothetical protein
VHYLTHDFGPDPARPGCTRCLWCGEPFERAGGTMCQVDPAARAAAHSATDELPIVEQPRPPRPWSLWAAAALLTIVVIALGTALGWMLVTGSYDVPYDPGPAATP